MIEAAPQASLVNLAGQVLTEKGVPKYQVETGQNRPKHLQKAHRTPDLAIIDPLLVPLAMVPTPPGPPFVGTPGPGVYP